MSSLNDIQNKSSALLDTPISRLGRWLLLVLLMILPVSVAGLQFRPDTLFTSLECFGDIYASSQLAVVRVIPQAACTRTGYDGQFYAQIAVDPSLRNAQLAAALDIPSYRARRIFLPALAYVFGLGKPALVVETYALLNVLFCALLLAGLLYFYRPVTLKDFLCLVAILWTAGLLFSIALALPDLPAATLAFYAACLQNLEGVPFLAAAILTKETSLLSLFSVAWPKTFTWQALRRPLGYALLAAAPFAVWMVYVYTRFPGGTLFGQSNFGLPFMAFFMHLYAMGIGLATPARQVDGIEILATVSLAIQAVYLLKRPRLDSAIWRMGAGFAVLFFLFGNSVFIDQMAFTRAVLPLTIAFNLLLMQSENRRFGLWFLLGNLGLFWGLVGII